MIAAWRLENAARYQRMASTAYDAKKPDTGRRRCLHAWYRSTVRRMAGRFRSHQRLRGRRRSRDTGLGRDFCDVSLRGMIVGGGGTSRADGGPAARLTGLPPDRQPPTRRGGREWHRRRQGQHVIKRPTPFAAKAPPSTTVRWTARAVPGLAWPQIRQIASAHDVASGAIAVVEQLARSDLLLIRGTWRKIGERRVGAQVRQRRRRTVDLQGNDAALVAVAVRGGCGVERIAGDDRAAAVTRDDCDVLNAIHAVGHGRRHHGRAEGIDARRSPVSEPWDVQILPLASPWNTSPPVVASTPPSQAVAVCASHFTRDALDKRARTAPRRDRS